MNPLAKTHFLFSCIDEKKRSNEQFLPEHAFGIVLSGESHFHTPEGIQVYGPGTVGLGRRNQLMKTVKVPPADGGLFKSINLVFDQHFLHRYASENNISAKGRYTGDAFLTIRYDAFVKTYFDSLLPYFDRPEHMSDNMAKLKLTEGLELLLQVSDQAEAMLFDFSEPFKIDLDAFMNKNYVYHVSLSEFAQLTGRSLATFKRDFQKTFNASPEKWLLKKRLDHAHFLIAQKKQSPVDVYLEVGFENLSHFSSAFKSHFGYNASTLSK